jgi:cation diffusion facilitator CzcD-associated flavoprotein CzcO
VLVVGAGNSGADIAVDVARVASRTAISMREATYVIPKLMFGKPADVVYEFWRGKVPMPLLRSALKLWLRLTIGRWEDYGLRAPAHAPMRKPPTLNSGLLEALRHGRLSARPGIERHAGHTVHFTDGAHEEFDAIIFATGFRTAFPFLPEQITGRDATKTPPLYLNMMHPTIPSLFFLGLFQPLACIWRLADYQSRIAALQLNGQLNRPPDIDTRIHHEIAHPRHHLDPSPRHAIEVDYHTFRHKLLNELRRDSSSAP